MDEDTRIEVAMRIAVMGTEGSVSFAVEGFDEALARVGFNTGNLLFQYAVWRHISGPKFLVQPNVSMVSEIRKLADCLVIPAANQINPNFNLDPWADFVEALDLPIKVVGLGAQAPLGQTSELKLNSGVVRFAKAISSRTDVIGVRGAFTQNVLSQIGVGNTVIAGCPSQMINPNVSGVRIRLELQRVKSLSSARLSILGGTLEEGSRKAEAILYKIANMHPEHNIVFQTNRSLLRLIMEEALTDSDKQYIEWHRAVLRPDMTSTAFKSYLFERGCFYASAPAWIDAMKVRDVAIGMRIHGAIAAIEAGRLGVCVAFDSRTLELSKTLGIPYLLVDDIKEDQSLSDLLDLVRFDENAYDECRSRNVSQIRRILGQ